MLGTRKLSPKHRKIVTFIGNDVKTKAEVVDQFKSWYYYNASKHIGDVLTRLVRAGWLERPMRGHYSVRKTVQPPIANNQMGLFGSENVTE